MVYKIETSCLVCQALTKPLLWKKKQMRVCTSGGDISTYVARGDFSAWRARTRDTAPTLPVRAGPRPAAPAPPAHSDPATTQRTRNSIISSKNESQQQKWSAIQIMHTHNLLTLQLHRRRQLKAVLNNLVFMSLPNMTRPDWCSEWELVTSRRLWRVTGTDRLWSTSWAETSADVTGFRL